LPRQFDLIPIEGICHSCFFTPYTSNLASFC
jgi:hypothetical protein